METTEAVETPEPEEEIVLPTEEATPTETAAVAPVATPSPLATQSKAAAAPLKVQAQKITESVVATGSSPVVQALVIAFLLLLGFGYFRIMRHGGKRGPSTALKVGE
ncbi:hypothetical protein ACFUCV_12675 [Specibacter sp. NPDC057265]|uniref:hypothetical protein n=1 Tax=Specibacter sp. NPDC057265 TaxID=3346075 RepID=UPI00363059B8